MWGFEKTAEKKQPRSLWEVGSGGHWAKLCIAGVTPYGMPPDLVPLSFPAALRAQG